MTISEFRTKPKVLEIVQRCTSPSCAGTDYSQYHRQTASETAEDIEKLAARLRQTFPGHDFAVRGVSA